MTETRTRRGPIWGISLGVLIAAVAAVLLYTSGIEADETHRSLPQWRFDLPWILLAIGVVVTIVATAFVRRWLAVVLGIIALVVVALVVSTAIVASNADAMGVPFEQVTQFVL